jgi:ligand-binding sensor domain-containing protein
MEDGLLGNYITCIMEDKAGNIWFGAHNGASRYNPLPGRKAFTNFTIENCLNGNSVNSIAQDLTGKLWFGTRDGVSYLDPSDTNPHPAGKAGFVDFKNSEGHDFYNVRSIVADRSGNILIGSEGDGLWRYNGQSFTDLKSKFTSFILEDKKGNLWLSASCGDEYTNSRTALNYYNGTDFTKITEDDQIFGIFEDKDGYIWFGTTHGVCRYDGKTFNYFKE